MALGYISPTQMEEFKKRIILFAAGAPALKAIHTHYHPKNDGFCDLTGSKAESDIVVLANRAKKTIKLGKKGLNIAANFIDFEGLEVALNEIKEQKKALKQKQQDLLEERKKASRSVVIRRKK